MLRKTMVLVLAITLGALVAFALPASANWEHKKAKLLVQKTITLKGQVKFGTSLGGIQCEITTALELIPGTTGFMETFEPEGGTTPEKCKGNGGLAFCQIHHLEPKGLPYDTTEGTGGWKIHTSGASSIEIINGLITVSLEDLFCPYPGTFSITPDTIIATPDKSFEFSSFNLSGALQADIKTSQGETQVAAQPSGTLTVEGQDAKTYGV